MALPPCHVLSQFNVNNDNELSCLLYQRSGDVGLGVPFNIASYGMLTHIIAKHCNLKPGYLIHNIGDAHIYENHIQPLKKQIFRPYYSTPKIIISKKKSIDDYEFKDFKKIGSAFAFQILTFCLVKILLSVEPFINHNNSFKQLFHANFLLVKKGTLSSCSENFIFAPNKLNTFPFLPSFNCPFLRIFLYNKL